MEWRPINIVQILDKLLILKLKDLKNFLILIAYLKDVQYLQVSTPSKAMKFLYCKMFGNSVCILTFCVLIHHLYFNFNLNNFSNSINHDLTGGENAYSFLGGKSK
jgi:hypothetical protein